MRSAETLLTSPYDPRAMRTQGKLFVFEGADGVGKSTIAEWFASHLRQSGADCTLLSFPGREPGTLGRHVYELHHEPAQFGIEELSPASLQLLHVAAHIDSIERRIKPLLATGHFVVLDRFWWSTFVYGLVGGVPRAVLDGMISLERSVWVPIQPERLFLITRSSPLQPEPTRIWEKWRDTYLALAEQERRLYPIIVLENDQDMSFATKRILESI